MPKRNAEQKAAWALKGAEGLDYQEALRRVRAEAAAEPATVDASASAPAAVVYVLQPTAAEAELGITAEELGVRALPEAATPEHRAHAEAVWRPTEAEQPCRCSGSKCRHGAPCGVEYLDGPCEGRMQHVDRHPGSMFALTAWYDVYRCEDCAETFEATAELPELPWGEVRNRDELDGTERTVSDGLGGPTVTVIYHGIRHPNFPDGGFCEEDQEDELDPDDYPTPEGDYDGYEDLEDEEPLAEEDQEDGLDRWADEPRDDGGPIGAPPESYDEPDEDELGPPSRVPAVDLDPQPTAADWSPEEARSW